MKHAPTLLLILLSFGLASACGPRDDDEASDIGTSGSGGDGGSGSSTHETGGADAVGGQDTGGAAASGGSSPGSGGAEEGSGGAPSGGATAAGGEGSGGETPVGDCSFSVITSEVSSEMATVGIVEWAVSGTPPTSAKIVYELEGAAAEVLNRGGEAPVNLERENYRTLLLGLKQESNYTFFIETVVEGVPCISEEISLPQTGTLTGSPAFDVTVQSPDAREPGFIVATSGYKGDPDTDTMAFILDADGDTVWAASAPPDSPRAKMDYEGEKMWMMALNFGGGLGEMRYLSMDGKIGQKDVEGLERAHHDFTVMPGGKIATMAWTAFEIEPESDLLIRSPEGTVETAFRIGANLYASVENRYHSNALHYSAEDDSFTISDRNPNLIVKVSSRGELKWQLGGSCDGAPAGLEKCSPQSWVVNHGHHLLSDGSIVIFTNGTRGGETSYVVELDLTETETSMSATLVKDYVGTQASGILGDVQRLPGGNTLITYSDAAQIVEVDADWQVVQTFAGSIGYADFRPTLYGPPARL